MIPKFLTEHLNERMVDLRELRNKKVSLLCFYFKVEGDSVCLNENMESEERETKKI